LLTASQFLHTWLFSRNNWGQAIIGSFAAGLVLAETDKRHDLEAQLLPVTDFLPLFFITVGAELIWLCWETSRLCSWTALTLTAILGRLVCGYAAFGTKANKLADWSGYGSSG